MGFLGGLDDMGVIFDGAISFPSSKGLGGGRSSAFRRFIIRGATPYDEAYPLQGGLKGLNGQLGPHDQAPGKPCKGE